MVLGDSTAAYDTGGPLLPFHAGLGMDQHEDAIVAVGARASVGPSKMTLRDWNRAHPSLNMQVQAPTPLPAGPEYYDYPGEYLEPSQGQRKVDLRAEAVVCSHAAVKGRTFCARLVPGLVWKLDGAPNAAFDGGYVVTVIEHDFERTKSGFSNGFEALRDDVVYRPPVVTEAPRLLNPMTGFVTGAHGDDICTNEMGDVKVHFHWDRQFPYDNTCSHWVPVLQDNTGHSMGISRVGWEVLVHYQEGDPDRPVVLGRVYNADDNFPQRLPDMKTRSALKSLWSPREVKGEEQGTNEIQFEDLKGSERMMSYAERDQNIVIAGDKNEDVFEDETRIVKHDEKITIGGDQTMEVHADHMPQVQHDQKWTVSGDRTRHTQGNESTTVHKDRKVKISGSHERHMGTDDRTNVVKDFKETVSGAVTEKSEANNLVQAEKTSELTVSGSLNEEPKENKMESTTQKRTESISGDLNVTAQAEVGTRCDATRTTRVGALTASANEEMVIAGIKHLETHSATGLFDGAQELTLKVGDTQIIMKKDTIAMVTDGQITIDTQGQNELTSTTSIQI
jgi:type VI secretion system secreted protein VgrG